MDRSVGSVLSQTYKNIEIVIVNDGSIDNTQQLAENYKEKHENIVLISTENRGVSAARNIGIEKSTGEIICFLDADDHILPETLEILCGDLIENKADVACCRMGETPSNNIGESCVVWGEDSTLVKTLEDNPFTYSSCGKLFTREILENIRFVEGRKIHEDSFFVFSCFAKSPRVTVRDDVMYVYTPNQGSASHAPFSEKFFDILYFAEQKKNIVDEKFPQFSDLAKNIYVKANIALLQNLLRAPKGKYKNEIKCCIKTIKKYKKYFIPSYRGDRKRFFIIVNNLYYIFRVLYRIKNKIR